MNINSQSLQAFLADRGAGSESRLYVKNKELHYGNDIGCMSRFAAKLGFGSASMSNVAKFIRKNQDVCFANVNDIPTYNNFIVSYNDKQSICWKKARQIKRLVLLKPVLKGDVRQAINTDLENGRFLLQNQDHKTLIKTCQKIKEAAVNLSRSDKNTLNEVLLFKNQVRNASFPHLKMKPLKGLKQVLNEPKSDQEKKTLRAALKELKTEVLKKRFYKRLKRNQIQLDALKHRFKLHRQALSQTQFLEDQLNRWQNKLDHGKPIAIPKWYHCTKAADTAGKILDTDILFMKTTGFPGVFVSNKPEHDGYGDYCFMLSERIEKTGTRQNGTTAPLYPKQSSFSQGYGRYAALRYADTPQVSDHPDFYNHQSNTSIWLGFQRGHHTLDYRSTKGTEGIPIKRPDRIRNGALEYYKDTSVAFIFNKYDDRSLTKIGTDRRIQVITNAQATALRTLINATFYTTLPADWQGKIKSFSNY